MCRASVGGADCNAFRFTAPPAGGGWVESIICLFHFLLEQGRPPVPRESTGRFPCNSPKEKMVIASLTGVVEVMRKGLVPAVMANARIVSLLREGARSSCSETRRKSRGV